MAENMDSMSRADLEALARERGVENPESFKNKDELLVALRARLANNGMNPNPFAGDDDDDDDEGDDDGDGDFQPPPPPDVNISGDLRPSTGSAANPTANVVNEEMATRLAQLESELAALQAQVIDPVTNQRPGDFLPSGDSLDERTQALVIGGRRASGVMGRAEALNKTMRARASAESAMERNEAALEQVRRDNPLPRDETVVIDPATYRARMNARVAAEARTLGTSTTIPGGAFVVNGELVNAFGDLIDEDGSVLQKRS